MPLAIDTPNALVAALRSGLAATLSGTLNVLLEVKDVKDVNQRSGSLPYNLFWRSYMGRWETTFTSFTSFTGAGGPHAPMRVDRCILQMSANG